MERSLLLPGMLLAVTVALSAATPGCGRNGQGERCSRLNADEDCEPGLVCTDGSVLGQKSDVCCPADLAAASDRRCAPNTGTGGEGGTDTTTTTGTGGGGDGGGGNGGNGGTGGGGNGGNGGNGGMM